MFNNPFENTIQHISQELEDMAREQRSLLQSVASEKEQLGEAKRVAGKSVTVAAAALLSGNDDARIAQLTEAARMAGLADDFTALAATWKAEDEENRAARTQLENSWGARAAVAEKTAVLKQELDVTASALDEVGPEVKAYDRTQALIDAHNKAYPSSPITEENHDGYEQFNFMRWLKSALYINRGPQNAYRIINEYTKVYGDFYEDAQNIAKLRADAAKLTAEKAERSRAYGEVKAVGEKMDALDASYRGAEGITRGICALVGDRMRDNPEFVAAMAKTIDTPETATMALGVLKIKAFDRLGVRLENLADDIRNVAENVERTQQAIGGDLYRIGGRKVFYNIDNDERALQREEDNVRDYLRTVVESRARIAGYTVGAARDLDAADIALRDASDLTDYVSRVDLDFSALRQAVSNELAEFQREERQRREAEEQARRATAAAAAAATVLAQQMRDKREAREPFNNAGLPSRQEPARGSDSVFGRGDTGSSRKDSSPFSRGDDGSSRRDSNPFGRASEGSARSNTPSFGRGDAGSARKDDAPFGRGDSSSSRKDNPFGRGPSGRR